MTESNQTISIRLPAKTREKLDLAAKRTRRSRSFLMQAALERHLSEIIDEQESGYRRNSLKKLLDFAQAGSRPNPPRSAEEIEAHIRWLRGQ